VTSMTWNAMTTSIPAAATAGQQLSETGGSGNA
jgi:hypothetical protein